MKGALRFLICGALLLSASAQDLEAQNTADTPWKKTEAVGSTWRGFPTSTFPIGKWTLVVALPTEPLEGNPWIRILPHGPCNGPDRRPTGLS